jgi:phospholipid/cholesterol/gamma-HCH transport system substrate-binding protein
VKRAIKNHRVDFVAIFVLVLAAFAVTAYILEHQPAFNFGRSYYTVKADFAEASAVTSGQGQAVTIAGVPVGQVGSVTLQDGHAVVTMNIEKQYAPIYRNATVLLRPRTPLKDMYLELDPGTRSAGKIPAGGSLSTANTNPDVDVSEILSSLDSDSRNYLVLLLSAAAGALRSPGQSSGSNPGSSSVASLQETLKRFTPLDKDTKTFASLLATRQADLKKSVHNLDLVAGALGGVDSQLASLIRASDTNFKAIAVNDSELQSTLTQFPGTLKQTTQTLGKVRTFASATGTALHKLQPFAKNLAPALKAARPLFKDTTPVVRNELRPFSVALQPLAQELEPAAADLKATAPKLASSVGVLNDLFNELAYQGKGESRSYLFYGGWLAHITDSLLSNQDANGSVLQGLFVGDCAQLNFFDSQLQVNSQPLGVILDLLNAPPIAQIPGAKALPTTAGVAPIYTCPGG